MRQLLSHVQELVYVSDPHLTPFSIAIS